MKEFFVKDKPMKKDQRKIGDDSTEGPYKITKINPNATVEIKRGNYTETISIRRIKPFRE